MSVCVLGSVNLDQVLHVDHPPQLGETVLARSGLRGLGGKRFNIGPVVRGTAYQALECASVEQADRPVSEPFATSLDVTLGRPPDRR